MGKPTASELHEAARSGDLVKVVSILSSNPLAVNSRDNHSRTPLHLAAWAGHVEVVNYLCKNKADAAACAMDDMGAIHFASQKGHLDIIKALVSFGVSIKSFTRKGMTPLHFAAQGSHFELVKYLVRKGANLTAKTKAGKTPLDISNSEEISSYLEAIEKNPPVKERANEEEKKKKMETADTEKVEQFSMQGSDTAQGNGEAEEDEGSKRKADGPLMESSSGTKKARVALNHLSAADDDNQEDD